MQHLFRSTYVNIVSGIGHFHIDSEDNITEDFSFPPDITPVDAFTADKDIRHTNVYLYSYVHLPKQS